MSKSGIKLWILVVIVAFGITAFDQAAAGEKYKGRAVKYATKWQQIEVGDEEGHVVAIYEDVAIHTNMEGKPFMDGWLEREVGYGEINAKTGYGYVRCFGVITDKEGDQIHWAGEGTLVKPGLWDAEWNFIGGTGKFQGIKGKGRFTAHNPSPVQWYGDWEMEVELPLTILTSHSRQVGLYQEVS